MGIGWGRTGRDRVWAREKVGERVLTAVGWAVRNDPRMGSAMCSCAQWMKDLRSVFEMPPIGFRSALEQSYLDVVSHLSSTILLMKLHRRS